LELKLSLGFYRPLEQPTQHGLSKSWSNKQFGTRKGWC